jgi:hypothetical protein
MRTKYHFLEILTTFCARHVGDGITTEGDFGDFEHDRIMFQWAFHPSDCRERNHKASSTQNVSPL